MDKGLIKDGQEYCGEHISYPDFFDAQHIEGDRNHQQAADGGHFVDHGVTEIGGDPEGEEGEESLIKQDRNTGENNAGAQGHGEG